MSFLADLARRAAAVGGRIAFPEVHEPRTVEAIRRLEGAGAIEPVAIGGPSSLAELRRRMPALAILDETDPEVRRAAREACPDLPPPDGGDRLRLATALLAAGRVDGVVAGADSPTAEVLRAGLRLLGTRRGIDTVSSAFYMILGGPEGERVLSFTDAAVVPDPTAGQLAEIAACACDARRTIVGDEPRVAFLSYATRGSAGGPSVARVRRARELFEALRPEVVTDGELQADAALEPGVAERKAPGSPLAGRANVLVFPDLDAGNIGYKLVQRLAGGYALGPILQGLARPLNDLSRGASVEEIVHVAHITALMAAEPDPAAERMKPPEEEEEE